MQGGCKEGWFDGALRFPVGEGVDVKKRWVCREDVRKAGSMEPFDCWRGVLCVVGGFKREGKL